jgi:hypothetical protein
LNGSTTLTLGSGIFTASQYDYVVTVTQSTSGSATFTFQYDTPITTAPTITAMTITVNSPSFTNVSGVKVLTGTPTYTVTTTVSNMGNFFYSSPLLTYTASPAVTTASETNLSKITAGNSGGAFAASITFTNTSIGSVSLASIFATSITMSGVANNMFAASASFPATAISAIIDGPSATLVTSTLAQTIPTLTPSSSATTGYRVSSGTAGAANVPPFNASGTPYANTAYDNTASLVSNQELQIVNGKFTTPSGQANSYLNYSSSLSNTVNYSGISATGYRYATFAWRLAAGTYSTLVFSILSTSTVTNTGNLAYMGGSPIYLFYRIEDTASSAPTNLSNRSSAWINGNSTSGTQTGSGNYYLPTDSTQTPNWGLNAITINGTSSTAFNVQIPAFTISTQTVNLYCRIGLPMNVAGSFGSVTADVG